VTRKRTFSCCFCHVNLSSQQWLFLHLNEHTREKSLKCIRCGQMFMTASKFRRHIRVNHTSRKNFKCNFCGIRRPSKNSLNGHIANEHTKDHKIMKCYFCQQKFAYITPSHMAIHTREYLHFCRECPKVFRTNHRLKRHYLRDHSHRLPLQRNWTKSSKSGLGVWIPMYELKKL